MLHEKDAKNVWFIIQYGVTSSKSEAGEQCEGNRHGGRRKLEFINKDEVQTLPQVVVCI